MEFMAALIQLKYILNHVEIINIMFICRDGFSEIITFWVSNFTFVKM